MYASPYKNSLDCVRTILRTEGIAALYRSYTTQLAMNIPFQIVHFSVYEQAQNLCNFDRTYNPISHMVSGGVAGAAAALITNPFDVAKTLLNTQEPCCHSGRPSQRGLVEAMRMVYNCRGVSGFFRGAWARMIFQMPSAAISWSVYEFFKMFITRQSVSATSELPEGAPGNDDTRKPKLITPSPVYANEWLQWHSGTATN